MSINLVGMKFGLLTVLEKAPSQRRHDKWHCICDCGKKTNSFGFCLRNGKSKSCGCIAANKSKERWKDPTLEARKKQSEKSKTHGMSKHKAYQSWADMKQRCNNKKHKWYPTYGGRGISVCDSWQTFDCFWDDMKGSWFDGAQIGRLNNDGDYCLENCRWETPIEQQNNKSNNKFVLTPIGKMTLSAASKMYGISYGCLRYRISAGISQDKLFQKSQRKRMFPMEGI